ncbi:MAG: NAD-dependent epimerase/dehydratase family protein [Pontiellaceae bacterium]|jgi:UDP-glucose 4-epimerase|nr:NAD-dependent epimerase/dehydratase family protein [Pontiellaceae bacterium]
MKYLVTGGAGFIGSHIVDALIEKEHEVVVLDNLSSGHRENLLTVMDRITFIKGDVRDADVCLKAAEGCVGIFHEAALVSVPDSINRPRDNHDINITGTLNVMEAARRQGVRRVVFASSASVYGDNPALPKREEMLPEPKSPYAMAKLAGEYYLKLYAECYGIDTVALRYFNVFGLRQDPSSMYSGVISIFAERIQKGLPITIYGGGEQTRDFVNVADVVQANLLAMGVQRPEIKGRRLNHSNPHQLTKTTDNHQPVSGNFVVLNVATGKSTSLLSLLDDLETIVGKTVERKFMPSRPGDIQHSLADVSKVRTELGYEAGIGLKKGLFILISGNNQGSGAATK